MKKIVASVGLVALGTAGVQTASAQDLTVPDNSKPWSVSATLRGFYDDNINTWPDGQPLPGNSHRDSYGFEISPGAVLRWSLEQTTLNLGMVYTFKYYDNKPVANSDNYDQTFSFNAGLHHNFSERYQLDVKDSFVVGQEPDLLRAGDTFSTYTRVPGDNIRNYGSILFDAQLTPEASLQAGYDNAYYDYADKLILLDQFGNVSPSLKGLLNRIEHAAHLDGLWKFAPETQGVLGYQYREIDYTGDQTIGTDINGNPAQSDIRNSRSHQAYLGVNHTFRPDLTASVRAGGQTTEYFNDPNSDSEISPYAKASVRWLYAPESYLEGGFIYDRSATDLIGNTGNGGFTLDAQTAAVYINVTHRITPKIFASVLAQYQHADYNGGAFDDQTEKFYLVGLNLEYRFNPNFSASIGYNYDKLASDAGRAFDRNRGYIGVTARY